MENKIILMDDQIKNNLDASSIFMFPAYSLERFCRKMDAVWCVMQEGHKYNWLVNI